MSYQLGPANVYWFRHLLGQVESFPPSRPNGPGSMSELDPLAERTRAYMDVVQFDVGCLGGYFTKKPPRLKRHCWHSVCFVARQLLHVYGSLLTGGKWV